MSTAGCYGSFALTNKLSKWNSQATGNKIGNGAIALLLTVIPVYPLIMIVGDLLILNTIEFWSGSNPVAVGDTYHETDAEGNSITAVKMEDGSLYMRIDAATGETQELVLQNDEEMVRILDTKGNVIRETAYAE